MKTWKKKFIYLLLIPFLANFMFFKAAFAQPRPYLPGDQSSWPGTTDPLEKIVEKVQSGSKSSNRIMWVGSDSPYASKAELNHDDSQALSPEIKVSTMTKFRGFQDLDSPVAPINNTTNYKNSISQGSAFADLDSNNGQKNLITPENTKNPIKNNKAKKSSIIARNVNNVVGFNEQKGINSKLMAKIEDYNEDNEDDDNNEESEFRPFANLDK